MQAGDFERLGGGRPDPHPLVNPLMICGICVGNRTGCGVGNRPTSADRLEPVIDRVFRSAEANEADSYYAYNRHVSKVVISGD